MDKKVGKKIFSGTAKGKIKFYAKKENRVSREKVENVVKPPHTPVLKNSMRFFPPLPQAAKPAIKPIATAPMRFVSSVAAGRSPRNGIRLIRYLNTAPTAPPAATAKKDVSFICAKPLSDSVKSAHLGAYTAAYALSMVYNTLAVMY